MANTKQAKFIIDVSAEKKRVTESSVRFFSYDSKTAEIIIQAEKEEQLISKSIVSNVEIFFESVDASFQPTDKLKWKDQMTVVADGLFSYLLPDELLNYQGLVAFEIYINYTNNDKSDSSYRIVYAQRSSAIDRAAGEIELVYIKDFEALKKEVALAAAETIASITEFYSGLDTYSEEKKDEMDAFSTSVGTLASAEKLKIQAELPKVQQTSTSETTKIKAEYPIIEQVATTEKEKIRAVLSTVDQTASEVSAYADRKISEYDAKFTQSNQKMNDLQQSQTALTTKLTETQQKITDSDVFTKAESSVNVIDQVIGKVSNENKVILDLKGKIVGSAVENPNDAKLTHTQTLLNPNSTDFFTLSQQAYDQQKDLDGVVLTVSNSLNGRFRQNVYSWDILTVTKKIVGDAFFEGLNADTVAKQVAILKKMVNVKTAVWGFGSNYSGNKLSLKIWGNDTSWIGEANHTEATISKLEYDSTLNTNSFISEDGFVYVTAFSEPSDGNTASSLSVDYANLELEFNLSVHEYINNMIAAYCRPLEQQINDLAQKVAAMENK